MLWCWIPLNLTLGGGGHDPLDPELVLWIVRVTLFPGPDGTMHDSPSLSTIVDLLGGVVGLQVRLPVGIPLIAAFGNPLLMV